MIAKILYLLFFAIGLVVLIGLVSIAKEHLNSIAEVADLSAKERATIKKIIELKRNGKNNKEIAKELGWIDEEVKETE